MFGIQQSSNPAPTHLLEAFSHMNNLLHFFRKHLGPTQLPSGTFFLFVGRLPLKSAKREDPLASEQNQPALVGPSKTGSARSSRPSCFLCFPPWNLEFHRWRFPLPASASDSRHALAELCSEAPLARRFGAQPRVWTFGWGGWRKGGGDGCLENNHLFLLPVCFWERVGWTKGSK